MTKVQMIVKRLWVVVAFMLMVACAPSAAQPNEPEDVVETVTMWVSAETADCVGVGPQTCLLVKFEEDSEWQFFYDSIAGFEHVAGVEYELLVAKSEVENPPADASTLRYALVEVVEETAVTLEFDTSLLDQLIGTDWNLVEWKGMTILPNAIPTLAFDEAGLHGITGCNNYFGGFTLDGTALTISQVGMTEMWCEGVMDQEQAFLEALQAAASLTLDDNSLTLHTAEGDLIFQPPTEATLTDTLWVLGGIAQGDAVVHTHVDNEITAEFKDGMVSGSSGCNNYSASYETDGATLTLGPTISTLMACADEEINQRESEFLAALAMAARYEIQRDTLTLLDADGNLVMTFQVPSSTP